MVANKETAIPAWCRSVGLGRCIFARTTRCYCSFVYRKETPFSLLVSSRPFWSWSHRCNRGIHRLNIWNESSKCRAVRYHYLRKWIWHPCRIYAHDSQKYPHEVIEACTRFFSHAKDLGLLPILVHIDKSVAEITAVKVDCPLIIKLM